MFVRQPLAIRSEPVGPRTPRPRWSLRRSSMLAAILLTAALLLAFACLRPPDQLPGMTTRSHALTRLERTPAPELGRGIERWRMLGSLGDTVTGVWREPRPQGATTTTSSPAWSVVLLGGIGTDDRAALLVPDSLPVGVLAVSWPWRGSRKMSRLEFVGNIGAMRDAMLRTPGALARGVEAVRRAHPGSRVALVGASLGVPPAVAAVSLVRPDGLALVGGGADLARLMRSEVERSMGGGPLAAGTAALAGPLGAWMLAPLEPSRAAQAARDLPTLLVDAEDEERFPPECIEKLHASFPHATRATHPGRHMRPEERQQMNVIMSTVWDWMGGLALR